MSSEPSKSDHIGLVWLAGTCWLHRGWSRENVSKRAFTQAKSLEVTHKPPLTSFFPLQSSWEQVFFSLTSCTVFTDDPVPSFSPAWTTAAQQVSLFPGFSLQGFPPGHGKDLLGTQIWSFTMAFPYNVEEPCTQQGPWDLSGAHCPSFLQSPSILHSVHLKSSNYTHAVKTREKMEPFSLLKFDAV